MSRLRVVPIGPPGAGKGTQSRRIAEEYELDHLATGDILRNHKDMETPHGTPREYMEHGELVPDPVIKAVVEEALDEADGFVLDGYPRTLDQAEHLDDLTELDAIIHLTVDQEELINRLSGRRVDPETGENYHVDYDMPDDPAVRDRLTRREDDAPEQVERRLEVFEDETAPVIEYYRDHPGFVQIDGSPDPETVWKEIQAVLDPLNE